MKKFTYILFGMVCLLVNVGLVYAKDIDFKDIVDEMKKQISTVEFTCYTPSIESSDNKMVITYNRQKSYLCTSMPKDSFIINYTYKDGIISYETTYPHDSGYLSASEGDYLYAEKDVANLLLKIVKNLSGNKEYTVSKSRQNSRIVDDWLYAKYIGITIGYDEEDEDTNQLLAMNIRIKGVEAEAKDKTNTSFKYEYYPLPLSNSSKYDLYIFDAQTQELDVILKYDDYIKQSHVVKNLQEDTEYVVVPVEHGIKLPLYTNELSSFDDEQRVDDDDIHFSKLHVKTLSDEEMKKQEESNKPEDSNKPENNNENKGPSTTQPDNSNSKKDDEIENPNTGVSIKIVSVILLAGVGSYVFYLARKKKIFKI